MVRAGGDVTPLFLNAKSKQVTDISDLLQVRVCCCSSGGSSRFSFFVANLPFCLCDLVFTCSVIAVSDLQLLFLVR